MPDQPSFQRSADARFLMQKMREVKVGEMITYETLAMAIAKPVSQMLQPMRTARKALLREENMVFGAVTGYGLKRLSDHDIVGTSASTAKKIKRAARRGVQTLMAVSNFSGLAREDQMRHSAATSVFAAVAEMTAERSIGKIEATVRDTVKELPFAATLDAFRKTKS